MLRKHLEFINLLAYKEHQHFLRLYFQQILYVFSKLNVRQG